MMKQVLISIALLFIGITLYAQQYTGMSGLIHVPSAEMDKEGDARIGVHFLNRAFSPSNFSYHTSTHYLSITPFSWVEVGYTCTIMKGMKNINGTLTDGGYSHKDRYFSLKIQPIKEGKWWPAVAIGSNDPFGTRTKRVVESEENALKQERGSLYFSNYYIAVTKHLDWNKHSLGIHVAYRKWKRSYNAKLNGLIGGITYRPSFAKDLRMIAEYTGNELNIGMDCLLWRHWLVQASLQQGKYFSGGICYQLNLF